MTAEFVNQTADNRPEPRTAFDHALHKLLDDWFAAQPTWATAIGFHAFDDRWPDPTDAGRTARLAMLRHHRARLQTLSDAELTPSERIDRGITLDAIDAAEFHDAELREGAWDPLSYVYTAGAGFFNILAREYAPWRHRGTAFVGRVQSLPAFLSAAADALTGLSNRPVSELHVTTALGQLGGIADLIDQGVAEANGRATDEPDIANALAEQAPRAKQAVDEFARRLRDEIAPRAQGEGRLGGELFGQKLRHTLSSDMPYAELQRQAEADYEKVRAEILRLARDSWSEWLPGQVMPSDDQEMTRQVLDAIARVHRQPNELIDWCREEVTRIEEFCRANNVIGLPDDPLQITWTPVFMRAYGRAFLESPGPLDKGLSSYFWITPPDESLGPDAVESYLREDNDRMLKLLCIHEGVPGHYLQLAWSNRTPSLARAVFQNGMFAEGWAVYVTQVLMDLGYGDHEPALMLTHWKFYLRAVINTLIDIGIHTGGMSEEQVLDLMVNGGFQEEDEARAKWLRARLTSTQLCTYYTGSLEMWNLEIEARRRAATGAGESPDTLPEQRIVGGLGETPGFDYRSHLESVISHGTPPIRWVGRILFD